MVSPELKPARNLEGASGKQQHLEEGKTAGTHHGKHLLSCIATIRPSLSLPFILSHFLRPMSRKVRGLVRKKELRCGTEEKRMKRNEDSLRDLWDNIKRNNIRIIRVPEGKEREKGPEKIFEEIKVENFPNMGKEIATQVQEAQRVPGRINPRRNMPRHIVIKLTKIRDKEKLLKAKREK